MKIKVFLESENREQTIDIAKDATIAELMKKLHLLSSENVPVRNNEITIEQTKIKQGDKIKFLTVASGG